MDDLNKLECGCGQCNKVSWAADVAAAAAAATTNDDTEESSGCDFLMVSY